ncbi:hypothetical protein EX30DRAFT_398078 [Ascodesmis nigricans]|uniref:Elongator complex protein 5 n=1 Tax=Ascodesmis nigricans TaxID=341454 RepID=A0A4S2MLP4_9PEZI|nr:hypothetical protein EX30DRAFT_398078 [Ascodesmis nigricans]
MPPLTPHLTPHLPTPPTKKLTLITSTLAAPATWYATALTTEILRNGGAIVVVGFVGEDLMECADGRRKGDAMAKERAEERYVFVDAVTELFLPPVSTTGATGMTIATGGVNREAGAGVGVGAGRRPPSSSSMSPSPVRTPGSVRNAIPTPPTPQKTPATMQNTTTNPSATPPAPTPTLTALSGLTALSNQLTKLLTSLSKHDKRVLILLNPEILIATLGVLARELVEVVEEWHEHVSTTTLLTTTSTPLLTRTTTRMEKETATFVTTIAHEAAVTVSLRGLETGLASDVSGVMKVTVRGDGDAEVGGKGQGEREGEWLYHVREQGVEVFKRGEMR